VADLAPPELLGRYLAVTAFSWQLGFIVGPAAGAAVLAVGPQVLWVLAAAVCAGGALYALRLDGELPDRARFTPALAGSRTKEEPR
jgi:MFS family permease